MAATFNSNFATLLNMPYGTWYVMAIPNTYAFPLSAAQWSALAGATYLCSAPTSVVHTYDGMGGTAQLNGNTPLSVTALGTATIGFVIVGGSSGFPGSGPRFALSVGLRGSGMEVEVDSLSVTNGASFNLYFNPMALK